MNREAIAATDRRSWSRARAIPLLFLLLFVAISHEGANAQPRILTGRRIARCAIVCVAAHPRLKAVSQLTHSQLITHNLSLRPSRYVPRRIRPSGLPPPAKTRMPPTRHTNTPLRGHTNTPLRGYTNIKHLCSTDGRLPVRTTAFPCRCMAQRVSQRFVMRRRRIFVCGFRPHS